MVAICGNMKLHNLAVIGVGNRGKGMAKHALKEPGRANIAAVAEPNDEARALFQREFTLDEKACFRSYNELLGSGIKLDGAFITTPPSSHADITCAFLEAGIPVFLEKPMATNIEDALKIVRIARKTGTLIQIGFNCRYAPFFVKIKEIVSSGQIGEILSLEWKEILTPYHWSTYCWHPSYNKRNVIGSWLLEKCCHDLDLINWITESPCVRVASFGKRSYFNIDSLHKTLSSASELSEQLGIKQSEASGIWNSKSDLVDHQSSILEYKNGITACFSLIPLGKENTRLVYICGTKATLEGSWIDDKIRLFSYKSEKEIVCDPDISIREEHGGGDSRTVSAFLDYLDDPTNKPKTTIDEGWEAMVVGCGIDLSLREKRVVELDSLRSMIQQT